MDALSHGLWAIILAKGVFNKGKLFLAFLFGVIPDVISLGIPFIQVIIMGRKIGAEDLAVGFSAYNTILYNIMHSLIIIALVFLLVYLIKKKVYFWMLGWPLHILVDIPSHSKEFFATKFLYPISSFSINGISWGNPYMFITNWILVIGFLIIVFRKNLKRFLQKLFKK